MNISWPYGVGGAVALILAIILLTALIFFPAKLTVVFLAWCFLALCAAIVLR